MLFSASALDPQQLHGILEGHIDVARRPFISGSPKNRPTKNKQKTLDRRKLVEIAHEDNTNATRDPTLPIWERLSETAIYEGKCLQRDDGLLVDNQAPQPGRAVLQGGNVVGVQLCHLRAYGQA